MSVYYACAIVMLRSYGASSLLCISIDINPSFTASLCAVLVLMVSSVCDNSLIIQPPAKKVEKWDNGIISTS